MKTLAERITELKVLVAQEPPENTEWLLLADWMGDYSEDRWSASWLIGLEYVLWREIFNEDDWNEYGVNPGILLRIATLAQKLGGWVIWDKSSPNLRRFVPMEEWLVMYREWAKERSENY